MGLLERIRYELSFPARVARLEQKFIDQEAVTHTWEEVIEIMTTPNSPHEAPRRIRLSKGQHMAIWSTIGVFSMYVFDIVDV